MTNLNALTRRRYCGPALVLAVVGLGAVAPAPVLAQGPVWMQRLVDPSPTPRFQSAMVYDSSRGVSVLFGGTRTGSPSGTNGETWAWDGTGWSQLASSGPSFRRRHAMAFDSARGVAVLFGGVVGIADNGETWEWNAAAAGVQGVGGWMQRAIPGPSPRSSHAMAYDSARGVTVLFGGYTGTYNGETWEFDGNTWTRRVVDGPSPRTGHAMAYDSGRGVTVLFGGRFGNTYLGDTWEWDGAAWSHRLESQINPPTGREAPAMAYDSARGVTVLMGGANQIGINSDTWEWDGSTWSQRPVRGISPQASHVMAYDTARAQTVLFGSSAGLLSSETWIMAQPCAADFNNTGGVSVQDLFDFLAAYFTNQPSADVNASGQVSVQDIFDFLAGYFAGCP
jgi:hypothetical protein